MATWNFWDRSDVKYSGLLSLNSQGTLVHLQLGLHVLLLISNMGIVAEKINLMNIGTSLVVQWLGLRASTVVGVGLIPDRGTKIPRASWCNQKIFKNEYNFFHLRVFLLIFLKHLVPGTYYSEHMLALDKLKKQYSQYNHIFLGITLFSVRMIELTVSAFYAVL